MLLLQVHVFTQEHETSRTLIQAKLKLLETFYSNQSMKSKSSYKLNQMSRFIVTDKSAAIITMPDNSQLFKAPTTTIDIKESSSKTAKFVPWGPKNSDPEIITGMVEKNEVLSRGLQYNIEALVGAGYKAVKEMPDGKLVPYVDTAIRAFFEIQAVQKTLLELATDFSYFGCFLPELILSNDGKTVTSFRQREAYYSRWETADEKQKQILRLGYSVNWADSPKFEDILISNVVPDRGAHQYITDNFSKFKEKRFVLKTDIPHPGQIYYPKLPWNAVFQSGWYDINCFIPKLKKALMENTLKALFLIELCEDYFDILFDFEGITDLKEQEKRIEAEYKKIEDFLTKPEHAGKTITTFYKYDVVRGTTAPYIKITPIKHEQLGGEYNEDSQESTNMLLFALGVHPSVVGATPGKNTASFSGTDKRELFMIKQAQMRPYRELLCRPLYLIKQIMGWPEEVQFVIGDIIFPTQDKADSSGVQTKLPSVES